MLYFSRVVALTEFKQCMSHMSGHYQESAVKKKRHVYFVPAVYKEVF